MGNERRHHDEQRIERIFSADRRTLPPDGGPYFNRLIFATSPYLLQHADNPVEWYPWGEEAFARARAEDRPVFLSIGYATCHWCHVMAAESFDDAEIAAVLNREYVPVKVDREERPDIDDTYMRVAQMMNGSGGWPLTIIMTPDRQPFFAATYIPRRSRGGMPGLIDLLEKIADVWRQRRDVIRQNCSAIMDALVRFNSVRPAAAEDEAPLHGARRQLADIYDGESGGFGGAPKFPMALNLSFLLRYGQRYGDGEAVAMATDTLTAMAQGGIRDHLGGGFHRYTVDGRWLVPHFEKMLYDQALCTLALVEAAQVTGNSAFRDLAQETCSFVLRELSAPAGGFYSALDADSEGREGACYLWTPAQVREVLGAADGELFCRLYDVTEQGNFEGANVLHLPRAPGAFARIEGVDPHDLWERSDRWRALLLEARERRPRPFRDEKIITGWNGLMVAALARTFLICGDERLLEGAERAVRRVSIDLRTPAGRLVRSCHRGEASGPGFLEDYAFFIRGLLELHEATLDPRHLALARSLTHDMLRLFGDNGGGLFDTGSDAETILVRGKDALDGAIPSGNAMAASVLIRLGRITGHGVFEEAGRGIIRAFLDGATRQPAAHIHLLCALGELLTDPFEVVIAAATRPHAVRELLRILGGRLIPGLVLREREEDAPARGEGGSRGIVRVCAAGACLPPVTEPEGLEDILDRHVIRPSGQR